MNEPDSTAWQAHCPVAINVQGDVVKLAHGEGGRLTRHLIRDRIVSVFDSEALHQMDDAARLPRLAGPLALTTDSFVVSPLFFPGGDIGSLAVYGTVNDLAVNGAKPLYLTLSLIIEEGFPLAVLDCILESCARAARETDVQIVAGDTKVVPRGAADGLFINTAGVGEQWVPVPPGPAALEVGDELIVTGPLGKHGIAVLCAREDLAFQPAPSSDSGSLLAVADRLRGEFGDNVRAMRDATRGGVAAVLHEWAEACGHTLNIVEHQVPVTSAVRGACELLGLDAVHIANEGTMVIAVPPGCAADVLSAIREIPIAGEAARIGNVSSRRLAPVTIQRLLGSEQPLDDPLGAPLPRIC